ncbi:MAG: phosphoglucosamine mutase [Gammaproteobacteria bacterium]|tara:strand:+ start:253 stop:1617 length:1365 start_codon:yes stop_codon:yes gene_type:complete
MSKIGSIRKNELSSLSTLSNDRKFGTDGIRGPVTSTMNPLFVTKLGWAAGSVLKEEGISKVLIGKDTRISGYMFESALQAGFISSGMDVTLLGPLPTPGVSFLANSNNQVGLVISASHNLFEDNGIKFFNKDGQKFSLELERRIEAKLTQEMTAVESINLGKASRMNDAQGRYIEFCKSSFTNLDLSGLSILLDCANGATYSVAPSVFSELGATVDTIGASPDGININQNCGSTSPDFLKEEIAEGDYDIGIAFDGDGDRILVVSSEGTVLDGDDILYILSKVLSNESGVIGTLMTNKALELYFEEQGINFSRADVGDKYVLNALVSNKWELGGEPSGHIICLDAAPTGDAIIAALKLLNAIKINDFSLEKSLEGFTRFPQTLINLKVDDPNKIILSDQFWSKVTQIEKTLGDQGRVLIRPSGTEPLIRLMVESTDTSISENFCNSLAELALEI